MRRSQWIYIAALLALTVVAYGLRHFFVPLPDLSVEDQALIAQSCAGQAVDTGHPLLATDTIDKRVAERYGGICHDLSLDPHLHFGRGLDAYRCRIWIPRKGGTVETDQQLKQIATLFGHRDFDLMAYVRKAGTEATVLLVTDDGEDVAAITDQQSLRQSLNRVQDLQGAAELIGLLNDTGRLAATPPLCGLTVAGDDRGWTLSDVKVPENCAPPWWRSYRIDRQGAVEILSSHKRWWRFDSAVCSD